MGQQRWNLRRVLLLAFRHRGGDDPTLGIHPNMEFLPALALLLAVFLAMPFALATDLQAPCRQRSDQSVPVVQIDLPPISTVAWRRDSVV